ncbi:hypothetical protein GCM10009096_08680 [Parasphingorhabdus litoris]|uniref:N-acetyltransferase domain-containing protein n=1 Tax=Parasphingorhabdus litoris TaxID=394733 RepID=A0ABN1A888_9SPHN|nr:ribosomal protein S18-alanine N-acetyltransferase [Parasphingorhabdus litoris]
MSEPGTDVETDTAPIKRESSVDLEYGGYDQLNIVMRIMKTAFSSTYGESWNEHQCRSMLSLPGTLLLIASWNQNPCGFAISREVADEEELLMIAVDPQYQNNGIGETIMKQVITNAVENGIAALFLEVRSNNPAQTMYQKVGFEKIGLRRAYYTGDNKEKFDAITYKMLL